MSVKDILDKFSAIRIVVIGDVMLDHYIWGDVNRISPEAPVPIVHVTRESNVAGGAANVAMNLASLGVAVELIGCVGGDIHGRTLLDRLGSGGVDTCRMPIVVGAPTIVKTRVVARTQQICRIDYESAPAVYCIHHNDRFMADVARAVEQADAVIVSDYAKGLVTQELLSFIITHAKLHQTVVAVDPKPSRHLNLRGAGLMTPNRGEALQLAGIGEPAQGEVYPLAAVARAIHDKFAPATLVITLGADGMALCHQGVVQHTIPTSAREVFDVSGAGDTVISALTAAITAGIDPLTASQFANNCAALVVAKMGTATVTGEELIKAYS